MNCSSCGHTDSKVLETRAAHAGGAIRRRRECRACGYRFTTMERVELRLPLVVKKEGTREPFEPAKVRAGVEVACRKRPLTGEQVENVVDTVITNFAGGVAEVSAEDIGLAVLNALRPVDLVAYVRFASVYREVQSPADFLDILRPWLDAADTE